MKEAATLSHTEAQIAKMIAWGASKKQIAEKLSMTIRNVEGKTRDIYNKVGVTKSNELSAWWFCTTYKIPFADSPLLVAVVLLIVAAALECYALTDLFTTQIAML